MALEEGRRRRGRARAGLRQEERLIPAEALPGRPAPRGRARVACWSRLGQSIVDHALGRPVRMRVRRVLDLARRCGPGSTDAGGAPMQSRPWRSRCPAAGEPRRSPPARRTRSTRRSAPGTRTRQRPRRPATTRPEEPGTGKSLRRSSRPSPIPKQALRSQSPCGHVRSLASLELAEAQACCSRQRELAPGHLRDLRAAALLDDEPQQLLARAAGSPPRSGSPRK